MAGLSKICTAATAMVLLAAALILGSPSAGAASGPTAPPAPAGAGIGVQPAHPDPAHPSSFFTFHSAPGTRLTDAVLVTNKSTAAVTVNVAAVDGLTGQTTGAVYSNQGDPLRRAGTWVSLTQGSLTLAPLSAATVPFTLTVPTDAVPGDHLAGIAFQSPPAAITAGGFQVKQVIRNVISVLVVVPGPAAFHPRLTDLTIAQIGLTGIASIVVRLTNDGLLYGKPVLRIALDGPNGYRRSLSKTLDTVLPSDIINYPFPWPDRLAQGAYSITAELTGGGVTAVLHKTFYLGTKLAGTAQALKPVSHHANHWGLLAAAAGALLLIGLIVLFLIVVRRRRRDDGPAAGEAGWPFPPTDPPTDPPPDRSPVETTQASR